MGRGIHPPERLLWTLLWRRSWRYNIEPWDGLQGPRHSPLLPSTPPPFPSGPSNAWLGCRFPPKAASWRGTRPDTQTHFRTDRLCCGCCALSSSPHRPPSLSRVLKSCPPPPPPHKFYSLSASIGRAAPTDITCRSWYCSSFPPPSSTLFPALCLQKAFTGAATWTSTSLFLQLLTSSALTVNLLKENRSLSLSLLFAPCNHRLFFFPLQNSSKQFTYLFGTTDPFTQSSHDSSDVDRCQWRQRAVCQRQDSAVCCPQPTSEPSS